MCTGPGGTGRGLRPSEGLCLMGRRCRCRWRWRSLITEEWGQNGRLPESREVTFTFSVELRRRSAARETSGQNLSSPRASSSSPPAPAHTPPSLCLSESGHSLFAITLSHPSVYLFIHCGVLYPRGSHLSRGLAKIPWNLDRASEDRPQCPFPPSCRPISNRRALETKRDK